MEALIAILEVIIQAAAEILLAIFHFFMRLFPRLGIAFLLGVAALLFILGYFTAGLVFVTSAFILLWMRLWSSKK